MDNALLFSDSFSVRLILDTYRSDQFTIVKLVGEHQSSLSPSRKFSVRNELSDWHSKSTRLAQQFGRNYQRSDERTLQNSASPRVYIRAIRVGCITQSEHFE